MGLREAAMNRLRSTSSRRWRLRVILEYDAERAGDVAPSGFVPKSKTAVLGMIKYEA
jgi:hypothetical protein